MCRWRPSHEASIEESCTIAPSRPIDPPEATVSSDEAHFTRLGRMRIVPSPSAMASMKSVEARRSARRAT
jgi:hypothetical protein